jgi:hypothetical protein
MEDKPFSHGPPWPEEELDGPEEEITQRRGPHERRGVWAIVKQKGAITMRPKIHCMTGHREEGGAQRSWCGQSFVIITVVGDHIESKRPEVYCRKCKAVIEKIEASSSNE